jgi:hypothetical protein
VRHERRRLFSLSVTDHATAEWIAQQITEAFPWDEAPTGLIRDRDARYGHAVRRRLSAMGIRDHPICAALTVAERSCRTADRLYPSRVPGSHGDRGRRPFAPSPQSLCCLLQRIANAPVPGQGRADSSTDPTTRSGRGRFSMGFITNIAGSNSRKGQVGKVDFRCAHSGVRNRRQVAVCRPP